MFAGGIIDDLPDQYSQMAHRHDSHDSHGSQRGSRGSLARRFGRPMLVGDAVGNSA